MSIKKKIAVAGILAASAWGAFGYFGEEPVEFADTRFNGAYRFTDGSLVSIGPSTSERLRLMHFDNGDVASLYYNGGPGFEAAAGFSSRETIAKGAFEYSDEGVLLGASWEVGGEHAAIRRIPLRSEEMFFASGELKLRGKLTLPEGEGPFPVVVLIHGSESYSAVDYYQWPYLLAANGIAGFKFDKRGTGGSEGEYTQHFPTLAADVAAAVAKLTAREDIDPGRINLAGFSQGGWIAPLVAKSIPIRSIMVGFGCAVPVPREDRWGYVKQLLESGYGESEIAQADAMNAELDTIIDQGDDAAWDRLFVLLERHVDEPWFQSIVGSDSLLGFVAEKATANGSSWVPAFAWKLYYRWKRGDGPNFNRGYDPRSTLEAIATPSLWLLAGEDSSVPTDETAEILGELAAAGKPIEVQVYPGAEHGNVVFSVDEAGERTYTGYVSSYLNDTITWFRAQNGL
ncbi:MAG: alpha/beta fold hydrolase [Pseudomonadota bacterium]